MPVTITSRMFYLLLKFSQKFHFRFKCHSKFSIYNLCYMLHQAAYIFSSSVSCIDHKATVFLRYLGSTHAITPQSAVHDQFAGKISFRSFKCTSSTWVFQWLFRCTLLTELSGQHFYFLEIAFFKREYRTQDNISCCFYDARSISHLKFFCRNLKNLSALVHYHYFSKNIFHFSTVRPGVHVERSAQ